MTTLKYLLAFSLASTIAAWPCPAREPGGRALKVVRVSGEAELKRAIGEAKPGTRIEIAPGRYAGSYFFAGVRGQKNRPIVITGAESSNPPIFQALHFSDPSFLSLQDISVENSPSNGINIDDGGDFDASSHDIVLRRIRVRDSQPPSEEGDYVNGIKLSGVRGFRLQECVIERWSNGSGVDMIGCRFGVIENCTFRHVQDDDKTGFEALLIKGGSRDIAVRRCRFEDAGHRAVNIGGHTDARFFRPALKSWYAGEPFYESKHITVESNVFIGGNAAISCTGTDSPTIRFNTIYKPRRWALRILQETTEPGFVPSRGAKFERNLIVFSSGNWVEGGVNIGPHTAPATFTFKQNWWWCEDKPESRPSLPTPEVGGIYGRDPMLRDAARGDLGLKQESPAREFGATALRK